VIGIGFREVATRQFSSRLAAGVSLQFSICRASACHLDAVEKRLQ
jgi:hypothetical protein